MRRQHFHQRALIAAVAGATLVHGGAAGAAALEEVVVTANQRAQMVQDVPYNISAVTGDKIEQAHITDTTDLMRAIPAVAVVDRGYRNSGVINGIMIRGLNVDGAALGDYSLSAVPTVSTYINSTPLYANFILSDIERVEVLRGPQGTLYGSGALGGTVRFITRSPALDSVAGKIGGSLARTKGSDGWAKSADAMFNLPLGEQFALRINGGYINNAGIVDYVNIYQLDASGNPVAPNGVLDDAAAYTRKKDADTVKIWHGRLALLFEPSDDLRAVLAYQQQSDEIGGRRQETPGTDGYGRAYKDYENGSIQLEPSSRDVNMTNLELEVELGFATLTSSSSYYDHTGESVSENTGFYAQAGFLSYYYNYPRPMDSALRSYGDRAFIQELRLVSNSDGPWEYVAGLYYQDQTLNSTQQSVLHGFKNWWDAAFPAYASAVTGDTDFDYRRRETFKDRAVYGELTYNFTDDLRATVGARYFNNEFNNDTFMDLPLYAGLSDPTNVQFKIKDHDTLFKGNLSWNFSTDHMLYGTVSQGYRRGGANAVPLNGSFAESAAWQRYDPDYVVNYEIGVKGLFDTLSYTAALFYVDWKDVQINTATTNWGFYAAQNGGKAGTQGLELELNGYLGERVHYGIGYAYVDAKLKEDVYAPDGSGTLVALKDARLPGTAQNTLNLSLDYTMPVAEGLKWTTRVDGYYQSSTRNAINRSARYNVELDGFQLWHLTTTLTSEHWDASLYVKNIFNEKGVTGVFTEAYMGTDPAANYYGNAAKDFLSTPRTIGVSASYRFGG